MNFSRDTLAQENNTFLNPAVMDLQNVQRSFHNPSAWNVQNSTRNFHYSEPTQNANQGSFRSSALTNIQSAPRALHNWAKHLQLIQSSIVAPSNSCEANHVRLSMKAQAQLQTQQIDSAIQLLKMQYDAIMLSVHRASQSSSSVPTTQLPCCNVTAARDQASFATQFELPLTAKSGIEHVRSSLSLETRIGSKRTFGDSASAEDISIGKLLAISESTDNPSQSRKRERRT